MCYSADYGGNGLESEGDPKPDWGCKELGDADHQLAPLRT